MSRCRLLLFLLLTTGCSSAFSQTDSTQTADARKRANKAAVMSALLPGAGQVFNKKIWKVPVLYAGFGTLYYFIQFNQDEYSRFKTAFRFRTDNDSLTIDDFPRLTVDDLRVRKDYYRRNRDLSIILTGVLYVLNIVDAYVDSQLMNFDVSDDLTFSPSLDLFNGEAVAGFKFTLNLK